MIRDRILLFTPDADGTNVPKVFECFVCGSGFAVCVLLWSELVA
jgi:hypothetical protein